MFEIIVFFSGYGYFRYLRLNRSDPWCIYIMIEWYYDTSTKNTCRIEFWRLDYIGKIINWKNTP